jgi:opacity protein-like surface antigen
MKRTLIALLASTALSGAAWSADLSLKDNGPDNILGPTTWTGFWFGAGAGWQFNHDTIDYAYSNTCCREDYGLGASVDLGSSGAEGHLQLGYDRQIGRMVVGLMGELNMDTSEWEASVNAHDGGYSAGGKLTYERQWGGVLGPRLGYSFNQNRSLVYVSAGWAFGKLGDVEAKLHSGEYSESGKVFQDQENNLNGWYGEIGGEHKLDDNWSLKIAGRLEDYSKIDLFTSSEDCPEGTEDHSLTLKPRTLKAMATFVWRPKF